MTTAGNPLPQLPRRDNLSGGIEGPDLSASKDAFRPRDLDDARIAYDLPNISHDLSKGLVGSIREREPLACK